MHLYLKSKKYNSENKAKKTEPIERPTGCAEIDIAYP